MIAETMEQKFSIAYTSTRKYDKRQCEKSLTLIFNDSMKQFIYMYLYIIRLRILHSVLAVQ